MYPTKRVPNPLGSVAETELFREDVERYGPAQLAYFAQEHVERTMVAVIRVRCGSPARVGSPWPAASC